MYFSVNGQDLEASIKPIAGTVRLSGKWQYACTCVHARTCMSARVCLQGDHVRVYACASACARVRVCLHTILCTQKERQRHRMRFAVENVTRFDVESFPITSCRCPDFFSGCMSDSLRPQVMAWLSVTTILLRKKTAR